MSLDKKHTLCLNMIVKDEAHIIENTLAKLLNKVKIDYWVISDTGSTDNTKEIIVDFFKQKDIPGELYDDMWQDFGYNRTKALMHAYNKSDYLLIFDADDEICGDFQLPDFKQDAYNLQFGDANGIHYTRTQLINNKKNGNTSGCYMNTLRVAKNQAKRVLFMVTTILFQVEQVVVTKTKINI